MLPELSTVLALTGIFGTWLISRNLAVGWLYMIAFQVPAGTYDIWTRQYGFMVTTLLGAYVYWQGWQRHRKCANAADTEAA